ncbi:MAG: DUF2802 domain-containing protein [Gammaproteobacteria bacterium]|nr:DUF2802 domain-containing protein [Gammaproteobacteria bacterium]
MALTTLVIMGFSVILTAVFAVTMTLVYSKIRELKIELNAERDRVTTVLAELTSIRIDLGAVDRQVSAKGNQISELREFVDRQHTMGGSQAAYNQALKMIERGEDPREVADVCGLTFAEAELLAKMHRKKPLDAKPSDVKVTSSNQRVPESNVTPISKPPQAASASSNTPFSDMVDEQIGAQGKAMLDAIRQRHANGGFSVWVDDN